jgi:hypothetical protein
MENVDADFGSASDIVRPWSPYRCPLQSFRYKPEPEFENFPLSGITIPPRCLPIESYFVGGGGEDEVVLSDRITRPGGRQPWSMPSSDPIVLGDEQ